MRFAALVLAASVLAVSPALAQTDPTTPPPAATENATNGEGDPQSTEARTNRNDEQICRTVQRTESRLRSRRERICATRAEWEMMQDQAARDLRMMGSGQAPGEQ